MLRSWFWADMLNCFHTTFIDSGLLLLGHLLSGADSNFVVWIASGQVSQQSVHKPYSTENVLTAQNNNINRIHQHDHTYNNKIFALRAIESNHTHKKQKMSNNLFIFIYIHSWVLFWMIQPNLVIKSSFVNHICLYFFFFS